MSLERTMALAILVMALAWALWPGDPATSAQPETAEVQVDAQDATPGRPRPGSA